MEVDNAKGVIDNVSAYKILTFDDQDDVLDTFSSLHHSVAEKLSDCNYNTKKWLKFYNSLCLVFDTENELYEKEK